MERIEAIKTFGENFRVAQTELGPAFEHAVETERFGALKLAVFEVGVVNHLSDLLGRAVADAEAPQQSFIRAIFTLVREFNVEHVVRNGLGMSRRIRGEYKARRWVYEFANQPRRADPVNFGSRTREPGFAREFFGVEFRAGLRACRVQPRRAFQKNLHVVCGGTVEVINFPDFIEPLLKLFKFVVG